MSRVLITGANRGIGLELTRSFADEGWHVHACCRNPDRAEGLKEIAEGTVGVVTLHKLDVTDGLRIASLARALADDHLDILINNAGIAGPRKPFGETDYDEWLPVFAVNTLAPMRMTERFVEHLERGERKLIVNISSRMGSIGDNSGGGSYIYRSSKAALNAVVKSMAIDLAPRGISAIAFHPGWVQTDMGGPNAQITPVESVKGMRVVMEKIGPGDSGKFFNYDGKIIPW
jgi:NAD(P)-dependent dehydrogenase (short-subunit alcohol dehydrogenase family)